MKVAVIDDEKEVRQMLCEYVGLFSEDADVKIETVSFPSGNELLKNYRQVWDILIFDIDMPGISGMETARQIRAKDSNVVILFITNVAQYAIEGYGVDAVDYILKPINYYEFSMKFHRAVAKASRAGERAMMIDTVEGTRRVRIGEILYIEVMAHYIYVHTVKRDFKVRGNMRDWEKELNAFGFCRIHKSYLVNLQKIESIQGKELTVCGYSIPISRNYRDYFMQEYMKFYKGE